MGNNYKAVLKTLIYSDIFHFPLTRHELWTYLISDKPISQALCDRILVPLSKFTEQENGYICLKKRRKIIQKRIARQPIVTQKLNLATDAAQILSYIPTIMLIAISGGLAVGSVDATDDIDLFIVTKKNTLWSTRLLILIILELMGIRRKRGSHSAADKICVNMMVDMLQLTIQPEKQDLYSAHEVVQLLPLFERSDTYNAFLNENSWVGSYVANSIKQAQKRKISISLSYVKRLLSVLLPLFIASERIVRMLQQWYMRSHVTSETILPSVLAFHPTDYRQKILTAYEQKIEKLLLK